VDSIYHSDSLYSAVTSAMSALGEMEEWLEATARNSAGSDVRFGSCFPFHGETAFIVPPKSVWPPAASTKVRWKSAKFVPLTLVSALLNGAVPEEDRWSIDGQSECLIPHGRGGPFRIGVRAAAAVDRMGGGLEPHATACLEFAAGAGLWTVVSFADEAAKTRWLGPVQSAFRLLADSGFGGERSRGWGRCHPPEFVEGALPDLIFTKSAAESEAPAEEASRFYWLLSLFVPCASDSVNWERGAYSLVARGGRVESPARSGDQKKLLNMVSEGSVLLASADPRGLAADVAPDGFPHPVYRAGCAVAIPIPQVAS
jgi:CRISPR type III-A-associated RAMP protein Csm4